MKTFNELRKLDVSEHIEKKNNLSYLSWAYAVDELLQADPMATWEYRFFNYAEGQVPYCRIGETCMIFCMVTAFGKTMTAQLPVMDHRNKAISNPDSFQVNTAMQRCLAKAISLHGIGLYIYAGEDLPEQDKVDPEVVKNELRFALKALKSEPEVKSMYKQGIVKLGAREGSTEYNWWVSLCKERMEAVKNERMEAVKKAE